MKKNIRKRRQQDRKMWKRIVTNGWDQTIVAVHGKAAWNRAMKLGQKHFSEYMPDLKKIEIILGGNDEDWVREIAEYYYSEILIAKEKYWTKRLGLVWE